MDDSSLLCAACGFQNPPGMKFCGNCGTRLVSSLAPQTSLASLPERLGVMMGPDLSERFRQAGLQASGQHRAVSVLFVDLTGYTPLSERIESEEMYELLQRFIRTLINVVYRYEGMVDKLTGDGLMALFGAPISHENNAERALRAALDMHQEVAAMNQLWDLGSGYDLSVHIGVNDGSVIVGGFGGEQILNYTAIGDSVNLARRLEENASPGTTLVSESVYRQTDALFDFQAQPPLAVKGKHAPVSAYRLLGPRTRPELVRGVKGLRSPMVGRETEFKQVILALHRLVQKKQGGLVLVMGEGGIGKSRLTREMKALIEPHSISLLEGQTLTYRKSIPYWIFQDLMRNYLEQGAAQPRRPLRQLLAEHLQELLGRDGERVQPYLEYMLALEQGDPPGMASLQHLGGEQLHRQIFLAMRDLLSAECTRRPMLMILEDVHWADDSSVGLILDLLALTRTLPLVIYINSRPFQEGKLAQIREYGRQKLGEGYAEIELHTLQPEQSAQLLLSLLATPEIPDVLCAEIINRSGGVPFFMEEMLRVLIEKKVIIQSGESWHFNPAVEITGLGVPETLQNLILARFDRLDPEYRLVLQTSAVIGYQFNLPVLQAVLAESLRPELERILGSLVEREFILPAPESGQGSYYFRHALMSDAIYGTLLQRTRKELHGKIGNAIEALYQAHLEDQVELLASHFHNSLLLDKALVYLVLAGQKAARRYANEQARQHFELALGLLSRIPYTVQQYIQVHEGLGDALVIIGEYQAARTYYQFVLEKLADPQQAAALSAAQLGEKCASLHRKTATTFERQGDYDRVLAQLYQAQGCLDDAPGASPVEQASVLNDMGWTFFRRGNLDMAEKYLLQALPLVENSSSYAVTASIYNRLGGIMLQKDRLELTTEYALKSLELRQKMGDTAAVARSYNNVGLIRWKVGKWADALSYLERSFELQTRLGDVAAIIDLHTNLGLLQLDRGETGQAEKHLKEALAKAQQIGHARNIAQAYLNLTFYSVQVEDWKAAINYSGLSLGRYQEIGVMDELVELYAYMGMACLGDGDAESAEEWGQEALDLFEQLGQGKSPRRIEDQGRAFRLLGDVQRSRCAPDAARPYYEQSLAAFRASKNELEYGRSSMALGLLGRAYPMGLDAQALLEEARKIFSGLGAALDLSKLERSDEETKSWLANPDVG